MKFLAIYSSVLVCLSSYAASPIDIVNCVTYVKEKHSFTNDQAAKICASTASAIDTVNCVTYVKERHNFTNDQAGKVCASSNTCS